MTLKLTGLVKSYGDIRAVDDVALELSAGETLALLGPSGCGKSTLLRLVAGLERGDAGRIFWQNEDITAQTPQQRGFGLVFQDYALFPHLNVVKNIAFGLVEQGWPRDKRRQRVKELLDLVGLTGYEKRRVQALSGGEQQRVALARALAPKPHLLLLDEPLSNLDLALREGLKQELRKLLAELKISAIYVTHDQSEAFTIAERIAVMRCGQIMQVAARDQLYQRPRSLWVARFLGHQNLYAHTELKTAELPSEFSLAPFLLLRSELIKLSKGNTIASVKNHSQIGSLHKLKLYLPDYDITVHWEGFERDIPAELNKQLRVHIPNAAWLPLEDA